MASQPDRSHEELPLDPARQDVLTPKAEALLRSLRAMEDLETFELEPVTNQKRWWTDDDEK